MSDLQGKQEIQGKLAALVLSCWMFSLEEVLFLLCSWFSYGFLHGYEFKEASGGGFFISLLLVALVYLSFLSFLGSVHLPSERKCQV